MKKDYEVGFVPLYSRPGKAYPRWLGIKRAHPGPKVIKVCPQLQLSRFSSCPTVI